MTPTKFVTLTVRNPGAPPVVTSLAITGGARLLGDLIQVTAVASGADPVVRVDFFVGQEMVGSATSAPYVASFPIKPAYGALFDASAIATDDLGKQSAAATLTIVPSTNGQPTTDVTGIASGSSGILPQDLRRAPRGWSFGARSVALRALANQLE